MLSSQQAFFQSGATLPVSFRLKQLKTLLQLIQDNEPAILNALKNDLNKSETEAYFTEILLVKDEIQLAIKKLARWMKPKKIATPFPLLWPGKSRTYYDPYGCVLIISPWNYPFLLSFSPLVGAISAGNCVTLKPSHLSSHTEKLIAKLIPDYFPENYIRVVTGNREQVQSLLAEKLDYIFFTGGANAGKSIMKAASEHLTPITLELGGKSPCIIDASANLAFAARRIAWAKSLNAGQTCVAPDFIFVEESCKEAFVQALAAAFQQITQYRDDYARIINDANFVRLTQLMQHGQIIAGGEANEQDRYIAPTLLDNVSWDNPLMQEEIFGPLLPILTFRSFPEAIQTLKSQPKPLALYLFTQRKEHEQAVIRQLSFGGGCINDCVLQVANAHLPFGGVGQSGMGAYHGQYSFETFSHTKGLYKKTLPIDISLQYPPYTAIKLKWLKRLLMCKI